MPESVAAPAYVAADQNTLETHTQVVDLSVSSTLTVSPPWPVSTNIVWILVLVFVDSMLSAELSTITLSALVYVVTLEILSEVAA